MSSNRWLNNLRKLFSVKSLLNKNKKKFVGEDEFGNKYYEIIKPNHPWRKTQRFFQTEGIDYQNPSQVVDRAHVPPAWDAWLRFRKVNPPTIEELNQSEEYFKFQQSLDAQKKIKEGPNKKDIKSDTIYQHYNIDKKRLPKVDR